MARCKRVKNTCVRLLRRAAPPARGDRLLALTCEPNTSNTELPPAYSSSISSEKSDDVLKKDSHVSLHSRGLRRPSRRRLVSLLRESKASIKHILSETVFSLRTGLFLLALCGSEISFYVLDAVKFVVAVVVCILIAPGLILYSTMHRCTRKEPRIYFGEDVYFVP